MAHNSYSEINLHLVWHTKASQHLLTPEIERFTHEYLSGRVISTKGVWFHVIGGTENHVHMVLSITPTVLISELVGQLKGSSSHATNR